MERFLKQKKGYTLVELLVAMGIFSIVIMIFTGFFVALIRLQSTYRTQVNLQQEARIISETFTRYAREASYVGYDPLTDPNSIIFQLPRGTSTSQYIWVRFQYDPTNKTLNMYTAPDQVALDAATPQPITISNVSLNSYVIYRESSSVYPKVLRYQFTLTKNVNGVPSPDLGDQIFFRGYINMRNEL